MYLNKVPKPVLIALAVVVATGSVFGTYWYFNSKDNTGSSSDNINYGPPTETELGETQQHKEELAEELNEGEQADSPTEDTGEKQSVTPIISYWGQPSEGDDLEVNGYVPGIVEKDGSCTIRLVKNSVTVEETKVALDDAQTTSCGLIVVPRNELSAGNWSLSLNYNSPSSVGSSETVTVTIN